MMVDSSASGYFIRLSEISKTSLSDSASDSEDDDDDESDDDDDDEDEAKTPFCLSSFVVSFPEWLCPQFPLMIFPSLIPGIWVK